MGDARQMNLPDPFPVAPPSAPFRLKLTPPGSKSLTNRALLLAALAKGPTTIQRPLRADDTVVMVEALQTLGVSIMDESSDGGITAAAEAGGVDVSPTGHPSKEWRSLGIVGGNGSLPGGGAIDIHNAGTAARFLTAAACLANEPVTIDGQPRMRERPIGELVNLLRAIGATIDYTGREGFPPVRITPTPLTGGRVEIGATLSSQFVSALLMIGPFCRDGLTIHFTGRPTSPAYVVMTLGLMDQFGATLDVKPDLSVIRVEPGGYGIAEYAVEPDASSATYFLAAAALVPKAVCSIEGLGRRSLQGDVGFIDLLAQMGAGVTYGDDFLSVVGVDEPLRGIDVDLHHMPDAAMTLAVVAAFAEGTMTIRGLSTLRHKETDRLAALQNELTKLGATVSIEDDATLVIEPATDARMRTDSIVIETYDDHRMAMAFAIAGLVRSGVSIADPGCVAKTYPMFWDDFARLRAE